MGMLDTLTNIGGMLGGMAPGIAYLQSRKMGGDPIQALAAMQQMSADKQYKQYIQEQRMRAAEEEERRKEAEKRQSNMRESQLAVSSMLSTMTPQQQQAYLRDPAQMAWLAGPDADKGMAAGMLGAITPREGEGYEIKTLNDGSIVYLPKNPVSGEAIVETGLKGKGQERKTGKDINGVERYLDTGTPVFPNDPGMPASESFSREKQLRSEFMAETRPYVEQMRSAGRLIPVLESGGGGVNDLALVMQFMKMLDPGSTVREGEIANVQNASSVPDQIRTWYNSVLSGESLSPAQREQVAQIIRGSYQSAQDLYKRSANAYTGLAQRNLVKPENVIVGGDELAYSADQLRFKETPAPKPGDVVDGYRFLGGNVNDPTSWKLVE